MSLQDRSTEELLKQKKKYRFGIRAFGVLLILMLLLYTIEQISWSTMKVLFVAYFFIAFINVILEFRTNKELKRRDNKVNSDE